MGGTWTQECGEMMLAGLFDEFSPGLFSVSFPFETRTICLGTPVVYAPLH